MKKVYIPTDYEIQQLQYTGINIYQYLLSKTVETLIMEDIIYEDIDMLDVAYEELYEIPEIRYAICRLYPEKIVSSELASKDINLCRILTQKIYRQDNSIYQLDNLRYFNQDSEVVSDSIVIKNIAKILSESLTSQPRYRFDYKEPNTLLDNIFSCELPLEKITTETYDDLISIDPIYITKLGLDLELEKRKIAQHKSFGLSRGMLKYTGRYLNDNIDLTNQQEKAKKLIRCLEYYR